MDWILGNISSERVVGYWNRLITEMAESSFLEVFKKCVALKDMV